jgi:hypothetical protein
MIDTVVVGYLLLLLDMYIIYTNLYICSVKGECCCQSKGGNGNVPLGVPVGS